MNCHIQHFPAPEMLIDKHDKVKYRNDKEKYKYVNGEYNQQYRQVLKFFCFFHHANNMVFTIEDYSKNKISAHCKYKSRELVKLTAR